MKKKYLIHFLIGLVAIVVVNVLAAQVFFRVDLTEDKRYTISPATKQILQRLDDQVFVTVYLEGELPAGFERLQTTVQERLEEFEVYAGRNIRYRFVDPLSVTDKKKRNELFFELTKKGIPPTNLFVNQNGQQVEKIVVPGALVTYKGKEVPVLLLRGNQATKGMSAEQILNQSVEGVEFELASAIRRLTEKTKRRIGFIEGYGGLPPIQMADLINSLQEYHEVYRVNLPMQKNLQGLDAIIIAKPDTAFTEEDKYKIDQYIVNGGNALFFIDALRVDSIGPQGTFAFPYNLNLDDLLFRYGVRLNPTLVQDMNSAFIPLNVGKIGDQPQIKPMPWRFFPLVNTFSKHPIVRNLDAVYVRYASSIDTVRARGITKTPLMFTSKYSKVIPAPAQVSYNDARTNPNPTTFRAGVLPVAYLLEGSFRSLYANRITAVDPRAATFKEQGAPAKIVVCSDGDFLANEVNPKTGKFMPLGFDRFSQMTFANKDFILHAIDYLVDEKGIVTARAKEIALRPLDKIRLKEERLKWQLINLVLPVGLIVVFGIVRAYIRRRKYTVKAVA